MAAALACGDDAATVTGDPATRQGTGLGPVYAMMTQVDDEDDGTVYISLSGTVDAAELSLDGAREFGGVANFAAVSA